MKSNWSIPVKKLAFLEARALVIAAQSHDSETKVAALLINPATFAVSADGYNGFVRGANDVTLPNTRPEKYPYMVHAEANLLCNAVRNGVKTDGNVIYTSISPCTQCLRLMWQAGISEFYFKSMYRDFEACTSMLDLEVTLQSEGGFHRMMVQPR
jgi:dCMP deaminase